MATIAKATYTLPIPESAEIVAKQDKTTKQKRRFARFRHKGRMIEAPLAKKNRSKCIIETAEWYVRYKAGNGKWKWHKGYTDKELTESLAVRLQTRVAMEKEGRVDPYEEHHSRPLSEHLADFKADLAAREVEADSVRRVPDQAQKVIDACNFKRIADISVSRVQAYLGDLRQAGLSAETCNHYRQSTKQFCRWLVKDRRTSEDRLPFIPKFNVSKDRRHDRRALLPDEFRRLIESAASGPAIEAVPGSDRAMLYVLSSWTGYRRKELASLTLRSLDLAGDPPTVRVHAAYAKNGRTDETPLHLLVVERLRAWLAARGEMAPGAPLFNLRTAGGNWRKTSKMMQGDLEAARKKWISEPKSDLERGTREASDFLTYQDEDGLFADFHSNRHTFITNLGRARVPLATAQKLARHSTPALTSNVYTHLELSDKAAAIDSLPGMPADEGDETQANILQATGTDDTTSKESAAGEPVYLTQACQGGGTERHKTHPRGGTLPVPKMTERSGEERPQVLKLQGFGTEGHALAQVETSGLEPPTPGLQSPCSPN